MSSVREFLTAKRKEIQEQLGPLETTVAALRRELAEVDKAETALGPSDWDRVVSGWTSAMRTEMAAPTKGILKEGTIKDFVVRVLSDKPDGLVAIDILAMINRRFGTQYPRTSLSPQLSRLKKEGVLERHGVVWKLAKEKGSAVGPTEPVSSDGAGAGAQGADSHPSPAGSTPVSSTAIPDIKLTSEDEGLF